MEMRADYMWGSFFVVHGFQHVLVLVVLCLVGQALCVPPYCFITAPRCLSLQSLQRAACQFAADSVTRGCASVRCAWLGLVKHHDDQ
jgi:hypothetical protein